MEHKIELYVAFAHGDTWLLAKGDVATCLKGEQWKVGSTCMEHGLRARATVTQTIIEVIVGCVRTATKAEGRDDGASAPSPEASA